MIVIDSRLLPRRVRKYLIEEYSEYVMVIGDRLLHSPETVEKGNIFSGGALLPHTYCKWFDAAARQGGGCDAPEEHYFYGVAGMPFWQEPGYCLVSATCDGEIVAYASDGGFESGKGAFSSDGEASDCFKEYFPAVWRALALCCPHPKFLKYSPRTYRFKGGLVIDADAGQKSIRECSFFAGGKPVSLEAFLDAALRQESD